MRQHGNPFGIALDQALLRWAAAEGVTETVIAAVSLLHQRSVEEIAGKLTSAELADVTRLVSRCPSCYPPGVYDALKARRNIAAEQSATTAGADANRPLRRHMPASAELKRRRLAEQVNRAHASGAGPGNSGLRSEVRLPSLLGVCGPHRMPPHEADRASQCRRKAGRRWR